MKLNFYDKKELPKNNSDYTCSICLNLVNSPQICSSCENMFCEICIEEWLKKSCLCSFCRAEFKTSQLPRIIRNSLEVIEIKCPTNSCEEPILLKNLKEHINERCTNFVFDYNCIFCQEKINSKRDQKDLMDHIGKCRLFEIKCNICNTNLNKKEFKQHFDKCLNKTLDCEYCAKKLVIKDVSKHTKKECLENLHLQRLEIEKLKNDIEKLKALNNEYMLSLKIYELTNSVKFVFLI